MLRRAWAAIERIVPRGVLAITTVTAAAVTDPHSLGLYSWAILALTFYLSLTDQAIRHVAVAHVGTPTGDKFLRRYANLAAILGVVFMAAGVTAIAALSEGQFEAKDIFNLSPLIVVPAAQAAAVRPTAILQRNSLWGKISFWRTMASLAGVAIGIPAVLLTESIVGASLGVMASEIIYTFLVSVSAHRGEDMPSDALGPGDLGVGSWSTYAHMAVYSALGWMQGQSERVLLGAWAGTSALGSYSLGSSVGRAAGDAMAASQANVLRVDLTRDHSQTDEQIRVLLARNIRAGTLLAAGSAIVTALLSTFVLSPILGADWKSALEMVPILALTAIPMSLAASSAPVHIQRGRARLSYVAPAICLLFAPLVALAAMSSLTMAAWTVLLRECVLATIQSILMGRCTPWRDVLLAAGIVASCAFAIVALGI